MVRFVNTGWSPSLSPGPSPPPASCWSPSSGLALSRNMIERNICVINVSHWRYFLNPSQSNSCAALSDVICVWTVLPLPRVTFISGSKNSWWVNILNLKPQQSWQVLSGTEKLYHPPSHLTPHTSQLHGLGLQVGGHFL